MNKRSGNVLYCCNTSLFIAHVKDAPIDFRVVADGWAVELDGFTQRETAVLFKDIDDFDAIGRECLCWRCCVYISRTVLLTCMPLFLFFLGEQDNGIANGICRAAMSGPSVSNEEKYGSLGCVIQATHLMHIKITLAKFLLWRTLLPRRQCPP